MKNKRTKIWTTIGIIISWVTFWIFLLSPLGMLAWLAILIYLIIKKSKLKWYFLLSAWLVVPGCSFLTGTVHYFTGTASLQSVGGPQTYHGIDRETRVVSTSSGCIFIGFEPFVYPANNAAVKLWTILFGFQRNSYKGIFPTEQEAKTIIYSADTLIVKRVSKYFQFNLNERTLNMDTSDFRRFRYSFVSFDTILGKTINNECFVFQQIDTLDIEKNKPIYVVDINKNKLLTVYIDYL